MYQATVLFTSVAPQPTNQWITITSWDVGNCCPTLQLQCMASNVPIPEDPLAVVRSRRYVGLLVLTAILGVPISAAAYWFLWAVHHGQRWIFDTLPTLLGFETGPAWWPLPVLAMGGVIAGAAIAYLPGKGGHSPVDGFEAGAPPRPADLPGVLLAALAS